MPEGLRLALTTLTIAPLRPSRSLDRRTAGRAMELAPLVGLLVGLVAGGLVYLVRLAGAPSLLAAVVAVGALAVLTRGLHLDGLADLVDGLASYRDPEGTRAVMRAPDTGPLGVAAVVLALMLQCAGLASAIAQHRGTLSLIVAVTAGRVAIACACVGEPAATPEGMGAVVAGTARAAVGRAWLVALPLLAAAALALDPDATRSPGVRALLGLLAALTGVGAARLLRRHAVRRAGGLTGDVLGALSEVGTTTALVVLGLAS